MFVFVHVFLCLSMCMHLDLDCHCWRSLYLVHSSETLQSNSVSLFAYPLKKIKNMKRVLSISSVKGKEKIL